MLLAGQPPSCPYTYPPLVRAFLAIFLATFRRCFTSNSEWNTFRQSAMCWAIVICQQRGIIGASRGITGAS